MPTKGGVTDSGGRDLAAAAALQMRRSWCGRELVDPAPDDPLLLGSGRRHICGVERMRPSQVQVVRTAGHEQHGAGRGPLAEEAAAVPRVKQTGREYDVGGRRAAFRDAEAAVRKLWPDGVRLDAEAPLAHGGDAREAEGEVAHAA